MLIRSARCSASPRVGSTPRPRAGRLPHVKLGRYYRYAPASIAAFVQGLERGPVPYRKYQLTKEKRDQPGRESPGNRRRMT